MAVEIANIQALQRAHLWQDKACRWQDKVSRLSSLTLLPGARDEGRHSLQSWQLPACMPLWIQSETCMQLLS